MGFHGVKVKSILQLCKYFSFFSSLHLAMAIVSRGGRRRMVRVPDSRTVAVVSVPASPWDGSPSMLADAAWGFVWASHGSMVWHQFCQHIQAKDGRRMLRHRFTVSLVSLFHLFQWNGHTSPWPSCREVEGGGWFGFLTAVPWPWWAFRHRRGMVVRQWRRMLPGASCWLLMARWCGMDAASTFRWGKADGSSSFHCFTYFVVSLVSVKRPHLAMAVVSRGGRRWMVRVPNGRFFIFRFSVIMI